MGGAPPCRAPGALADARQGFAGGDATGLFAPGQARPVHDPGPVGIGDDAVHQAFVVPDDEVADLPAVAIDEGRLRGPLL